MEDILVDVRFSLPPCPVHKLLRTLKSNLSAMQNDIPWDLLPKMFQDIIFLANILDVPYVWIDIVQDDPSDWDEQASRMSSIFSCSLLALTATAAEDSNSGCFTLLDSNFG